MFLKKLLLIKVKVSKVYVDFYSASTGFRGGGGPQASHQQGASHQAPKFFG